MSLNALSNEATTSVDGETAVSLQEFITHHNLNITEDVAIGIINTLRKEEFDEKVVNELLKDYSEERKEYVITFCACYLNFNKIPITYELNSFLINFLQELRFYAPVYIDKDISIEPLDKYIKYIKSEMDTIRKWVGKTDLILLYRIKQVVLNANGLIYNVRFKKLPWKLFVFYLQQYVRYFEVTDEENVFLITFISVDYLKLFASLFWIALDDLTKVEPKSIETIEVENDKTFVILKDIYDKIRNLHSVNRMLTYADIWKGQHLENRNILSYLRVLQVVGESIKNTDESPNLSNKLKKTYIRIIGEDQVKLIIKIRDKLAHLEWLPFVFIDDIDKIYKEFEILVGSIKELVKIQKANMSKEILRKLKQIKKIELPNGICESRAKKLLGTYPKYTLVNGFNYNIDLNFKIEINKSSVRDALCYLLGSKNILGMELILIVIIEDLKKNSKRLNQNREWMKDRYPTLSGNQLRNHLAHGDAIVEMLQVNEALTIQNYAKLLLEDIDKGSSSLIQKQTVFMFEGQRIINDIKLIKQQENILNVIVKGDLDEGKCKVGNVSPNWIHWVNAWGENVLQLASRSNHDDCKQSEFILQKNPVLLSKNTIPTNMPLVIAIRNGKQKIAKFLLERHIRELLNISSQNANEINYADELDVFLKKNHETLDEILTDKNCFILYCFGFSIDNVEFLRLASRTIYWIQIEIIFKMFDFTFIQILSLFHSSLVAKLLRYNIKEAIIIVEYDKMMELCENIEEIQRDATELECFRLTTGDNALHEAIKLKNNFLIEFIYTKCPHFILLNNVAEYNKTPLEVAINMKNWDIVTKILQLVMDDCINNPEIVKKVFSYLSSEQMIKPLSKFILDDFYSDDKLVQFWKLKLLNRFPYFQSDMIELMDLLKKIILKYSCDNQILIECTELIYFYIFCKDKLRMKQSGFILRCVRNMLADICNSSRFFILLYDNLVKRIINLEETEYERKYWLFSFKTLIDVQSKSPEVLLLKIKYIYQFDMLTRVSNCNNIFDALKTMAEDSSFNDLDDHTYYIWVDVFITITALMHHKLKENNTKILERLEDSLNNWNVKDELKTKLLELRSQNYKYLFTTENKETIVSSINNKNYLWYPLRLDESILQYVSLNTKISWEDMKCIFVKYHDKYRLNEKHILTKYSFEIKHIIESCLQVGNKEILEKLLEAGICNYFISIGHAKDREIKFPTLKDYNINNIKELINQLSTMDRISHDLNEIWTIVFYIIITDDVAAFEKIYNLLYSVDFVNKMRTVLIISPLHFACQCGATGIVNYFIRIGVDLNSMDQYNRSPLYQSVHFGNDEIKQLLIEQGATDRYLYLENNEASMDTDEHHQLHKLIESGDVEELDKFLNKHQEIVWRSSMESGNNCLHYAMLSRKKEMVEKVYAKCAHLLITENYDMKSPFDMAVDNECDEIVKTIINSVLEDYPKGVDFFKKCFAKFNIKNSLVPEIFEKWFILKAKDLLLSDSDDKTKHYWLTGDITSLITYLEKNERIDDNLLLDIIDLIKHHFSVFSNEQYTLTEYIDLFKYIALKRDETYPVISEKLHDTIDCILQKVEIPWQVNHIIECIFTVMPKFKSKYKLFADYILYAIRKFPNEESVQNNGLLFLSCDYENGNKMKVPADLMRNLLQKSNWMKHIEMKTTVFVYYFILHPGIRPENIDEIIDKELNRWRWGDLKQFHKPWEYVRDKLKKEWAKKYFRNEIINLVNRMNFI